MKLPDAYPPAIRVKWFVAKTARRVLLVYSLFLAAQVAAQEPVPTSPRPAPVKAKPATKVSPDEEAVRGDSRIVLAPRGGSAPFRLRKHLRFASEGIEITGKISSFGTVDEPENSGRSAARRRSTSL